MKLDSIVRKLNIKNSTIRKGYPIFCGLVMGGMIGGITHSIFPFLLFGGITWWYIRNGMRDDFQFDGIASNNQYGGSNDVAPVVNPFDFNSDDSLLFFGNRFNRCCNDEYDDWYM